VKRPLKNVAAMLIGDAGSRVIGFGVNVYLARILEPAGFGIITIGMAALGYLLLAASPGIQTLEARNVAALGHVDHQRVGAVLSLRLILALLLWGAAALAGPLIPDEAVRASVVRYAAALLPLAFLLDWFFAGREAFGAVGASKIVSAGVYAGIVVLLVRSADDLLLTPLAYTLGTAAAAVMLAVLYQRRFGWVQMRWDPGTWKRIAGENAPVGLATFLGQNVTNLPPIIIGAMAGAAQAGQFSAALKLIFALLMFDRLLNALFLPVMARYVASRASEVPALFAIVGRTVLFVILPLTILCMILAPWLIPLLFGDGYKEAAGLFCILAPYVAMTLLSSTYVVVLIAAGKERRYTTIMISATAVLATLVVLLTLIYGAAGAAWGVLGGETVALVLLGHEAHRITGVRVRRLLSRPLFAALPMCAGFFLIPPMHPVQAALTAIAIAVPFAAVAGWRSGGDIRFLREKFL
jgi:polysaccharide transporter, PST family